MIEEKKKYKVSKEIVTRGLRSENNIESYAHYSINETWNKEEYINKPSMEWKGQQTHYK